jgi:hypothetical protein
MPKIETLQEFITQAITCDNRLFGWGNANHTMISISSASEKNASSLEPMQIDVARYKPLLQGQKDQRCQKGLCYYYGSSKQRLLECPIKPWGLKA